MSLVLICWKIWQMKVFLNLSFFYEGTFHTPGKVNRHNNTNLRIQETENPRWGIQHERDSLFIFKTPCRLHEFKSPFIAHSTVYKLDIVTFQLEYPIVLYLRVDRFKLKFVKKQLFCLLQFQLLFSGFNSYFNHRVTVKVCLVFNFVCLKCSLKASHCEA